MIKRALFVVTLLALLLSACQSQTTPTGIESAAQETQAISTQSDLAGKASPVPTKSGASLPETPREATPVTNCTVVSRSTSGESLFPGPEESDWVVGSETAVMTIFEYSDFQ